MIKFIKTKIQPLAKVLSIMLALFLLVGLCLIPSLQASQGQEVAKPPVPRPLEINDILAWKNISSAQISSDGKWFVHSLTPNEGDSELVIKEIDGTKEYRFSLGSNLVI